MRVISAGGGVDPSIGRRPVQHTPGGRSKGVLGSRTSGHLPMTARPDDWLRIKDLFDRASHLTPELRQSFLDDACAGDDAIRREIESLLAVSERTEGFLETPAAQVFGYPQAGGLLEGRRMGPYEIASRIGSGGMGEVYKARDTRLDRTVAIKVLPAHVAADPQAHERFERE